MWDVGIFFFSIVFLFILKVRNTEFSLKKTKTRICKIHSAKEVLNLQLDLWLTEWLWISRAGLYLSGNLSISVYQVSNNCLHLQLVELRLFECTFMVRDNDVGPLVNNWDEEESRAQDRHQEEGPKKHSIQNLGYKLPVLYHLKQKRCKCFEAYTCRDVRVILLPMYKCAKSNTLTSLTSFSLTTCMVM